ncbi:MAG: hypothetical protein WEA29_06965 [Acidimicrobiia bacterium]
MFIVPTGWKLLAKGIRRGDHLRTFLGAALLAIAFARWLDESKRQMVHSQRLRPGGRIVVAVPPKGRQRRR